MARHKWWFACAAVAAVLLSVSGGPQDTSSPAPLADAERDDASPPLRPPTEHFLKGGAEQDNKNRRKAWFADRHRAPPGIDWKQIERENGRRQIAKRNALAGRAPRAAGPQWIERGSDNQAGRMHVTRPSNDGESLYAGSSSGGLWRSDLEGNSWTPLGDNLYGGVHEMVLLPPDTDGGPEVILAATGWGQVHRSNDDGQTWEVPSGMAELWQVRRAMMTTDGSNTVFLVTEKAWDGYALYRSTDHGRSFQNVFEHGGYAGYLWVPRDGDSKIYLLHDDEVWISQDLGDSWTPTGGHIDGNFSGGELVGSEAGAPRLYAAIEDGEGRRLHRSDDLGQTWTSFHRMRDYWLEINASSVDPNLLVFGGVEAHRSTDGGDHFNPVNTWGEYYDDPVHKLHADMMGIDVIPHEEGETWYISTDGGLYESNDGMQTVDNLSRKGLRVSQYYTTLTSSRYPDHLAAGSQDQGYQFTNGVNQDNETWDFEQWVSGDYAHLTSTNGTHDYLYSVYPGVGLVQVGEFDPFMYWFDFPAEEAGKYYAWLPPIVADPKNKHAFFFPATRLYHYKEAEEGYWTYELWSAENFDPTGYGEFISAVTFSPLDENRGYLATSWGRLFWSDDRGVSWTESEDTGPEGQWLYGAALHASMNDIDTVYVGGSGYGVPSVYRSTDGGQSWKKFDKDLPDTLVYCLTEAPDGSGVLFAGTETAAYRRNPGEPWVDITSNEAPVTIYWSVEALQHENTVRFGTYGRGIWDYQLDPDNSGCFPVEDLDGDGVACDLDCDESDPDIYPGADDTCDGIDTNCDLTDPDEMDADQDGYLACLDDCNDDAAGVHPGAVDIECNDIDEDCDGVDLCTTKGCGCETGSSPAPWLAPLLALLLVGVRRRRG